MYFHANILTNLIINYYFNDSNCLLIIGDRDNSIDYTGRLPYVYLNLESVGINPNLLFRCYGCQGVLIIARNPIGIFENFELDIKLGRERFNFRRYLFAPAENRLEDALDVFKSNASEYVADILVIELNSSKDGMDDVVFDLYTHKYIGRNNLKDAILLDRWYSGNNSFLLNANLYPDKLRDGGGKSFKIVCFTYKPYCIIDPPDGTDMLIALEYAKRHNMTPELIVDEEGEWGAVYENWTGNGVLGNLGQDKGDVGLGALYTWEREYHFFDFSKPVMRSGITCIAPAPRLASGLTTPFTSFSWEMWIMTAVSLFIASAAIFVVLSVSLEEGGINKKKRTDNAAISFTLTGRIFLLQSFQKVPNLDQSRLTFGLALILSLILNTIYSSGLSSTMTVPRYYGTIRDINDLVAARINWGATSDAWINSITSDTRDVYKKAVEAFIITDEEKLKAQNGKEFAYAVERLQAGNLAIGNYISLEGAQNRRLLDEDLYWEYCVIMLRKNSVHLPALNNLIFAVTESGLVNYWEYQSVVKYMDMNMQKAVKATMKSTDSDNTVKLGLNHVVGAFVIWAVGIIIATCTFIFELIKY